MSSASHSPWKAGGVTECKSKGQRTRDAPSGRLSLRTGKEEMPQLNQGDRENRDELLLPLPFVLFRHSKNWMMLAHDGEGNLLY